MHQYLSPARAGIVPVVIATLFYFSLSTKHARGEDDLPTILITASRFAETTDETLSPVTVITRHDIEAKQASTLEEVLRTVPGITLSSNGSNGQLTTLFLRGTNSNHVLVLIDGVKVGSATTGSTQFEHLPIDQIEKIEIVRGPRSSLYGSEAFGGVLQIFTRKDTNARASIGTASHNAYKADASVGGRSKNAWYRLVVSGISSDGYDTCRADFCATESDDDGYRNHSASLRGTISLTDALMLEGNFLQTNADTEFDGFFNSSEHTFGTQSVKASLQAGERWHSSLLIAQSKDDLESFSNDILGSRFRTIRDQISWQNEIRLNLTSRLVAGVDYLDDQVNGTTTYQVDSRDNTGLYASFRTEHNAHDWEVSVRNDDDQQFGEESTGSIGWGVRVGQHSRITASYGTAFKAPTFNVLYEAATDSGVFGGTDFGIFMSNPNLRPETSRSLNFGFSRRQQTFSWEVNAYQTIIEDLIANQQTMQTIGGVLRPVTQSMNIEEAKIVGIELSGNARLYGWNIDGVLTWQNAEETKGDNPNKTLLKRPEQKLDLDFSRRHGGILFGANLFAQSDSRDFGFTRINGFSTINLRGEFQIERSWSFAVKFNNIFDKMYETASGYPQDGLNIMTTLRYRPKN